MKILHILQLGIGNVGGSFVRQFIARQEKVKKELGIGLKYSALFNSKNGEFKKSGFSTEEVENLIIKLKREKFENTNKRLLHAISDSPAPFALLDLTA